MTSRLNPYISFNGQARQALEFYQSVLGGELAVNTFGDFAQAGGGHDAVADRIMHGQLETDAGFTIMAADTPPGMDYNPGSNFAVSLSGDDDDELRGYWKGISEGGTVSVPLEKQMWGDEFGMCIDKFGVAWMVNIAGDQQG
jgi:PhnB protein